MSLASELKDGVKKYPTNSNYDKHTNTTQSRATANSKPPRVQVRYAWIKGRENFAKFNEYCVQRKQTGLPINAVDQVVPMLLPVVKDIEEARLRAKALLVARVYLEKHTETLAENWMTVNGHSIEPSDTLLRVLWCHLANDYFPSMFLSWPIEDILRDCFLVE